MKLSSTSNSLCSDKRNRYLVSAFLTPPVCVSARLITLVFAALLATQANVSLAKTETTSADVQEKKGDLNEIRGQLKTLRKGMAATEGQRDEAADAVKAIDQEIAGTQRELRRLDKSRDALQAQINALGKQTRGLEEQLDDQQQPLEKLVYRHYLQGTPDALRLLLNGDNPNQIARDLHYLSAIGHARSDLVRQISTTLNRQQELADDTLARASELSAVEEKQKTEHAKLTAQRQQRKVVLDKLAASVSAQRARIVQLQRDEKQLSRLIDRLAKAIAARPVPRPKKRAAADEAETPTAPRTKGITNDATPEPFPAGNFARLKGRLRLPTRGEVMNRFGAARQEGSKWKGLFIRADADNEVKAIAAGRVVFADWMRGFGNLLIIDHGGDYLTIYGNNDALQKQVGDTVQGGDTIAAVGNSGGNPQSGLYFELRFKGTPVDPLRWVSLK